jgi:muramoyltetrapeptide carboxypeptidase
MRIPSYLKPGDLIRMVAPAKSIDVAHVDYATKWLTSHGFKVEVSKHCLGEYHYFSGSDEERCSDLQEALDCKVAKAILCARGGYGCVRIVDSINWDVFQKHPKWLIGFSDITVLHHRVQRLGIQSIHGTMPLNFEHNTDAALQTLLLALKGESLTISTRPHIQNVQGIAKGKIVGGNLSIVYSLLSTDDALDMDGNILFLEDVSEQLYHIDRMFSTFRKSGVLDKISGLVIGGMTELKDTAVPFGMTIEELILSYVKGKQMPVSFGFPSGHIDDNQAIVMGSQATLSVSETGTVLAMNE